jgi:hypothetical protein
MKKHGLQKPVSIQHLKSIGCLRTHYKERKQEEMAFEEILLPLTASFTIPSFIIFP